MKQAIDDRTFELDLGDTVCTNTSVTPTTTTKPTPTKPTYRFYVRTATAQTEWCGLTKKQARDMYAYTDAHQPSNVIRYGWEEVK